MRQSLLEVGLRPDRNGERTIIRYLKWGFVSSGIGLLVSLLTFLLICRSNNDICQFAIFGPLFGFCIGFVTAVWDHFAESFSIKYFGRYPLFTRIVNFSFPTFVILISTSFLLGRFECFELFSAGLHLSSFACLGVAASVGTIGFMYETFGQYIDSKVRSRVLIDGYDQKGETIDVAVLFVDIRNSTLICEKMPPDDFVSLLNEFFKIAINVISKNNGVVNKFMGDAILAFWGQAFLSTSPCLDAAAASLQICQKLEEMNVDWLKRFGFAVEIGIGIHYGSVIAGNIGGAERKEFTIIGDTVNTAKRLEELTKITETKINISENVLPFIENAFETGYIGDYELKGKNQTEAIYSLVGPKG